MSYLGQVELKSSEIRRVDVTGSTSATHTLTWTPASEQSLIITINGIKQQNNYSISGTTLTLDDALLSADKMEVIGILDIGEAVTPPDDSISTAKIQDDAVTADKLANSINTEITANTAKVTNATHTGDVTGATALTIATDAVDIAMLSATGTADATTFLRGDNAWSAVATGTANEPNFYVKTSATQTWSSSYTNFVFDTLVSESDTGSFDTTTNYRFTVPTGKGGTYLFAQNFGISPDKNYYVRTELNGSVELWWEQNSAADVGSRVYTHIVVAELSAGDYVEWLKYSTSTSTEYRSELYGVRLHT